ncbi:hypothetical protein [Collinsella aerofaciens]|uniref:hypothetical protein n=2 Tax=Collinsella aerofaciens TaxID=74426 RepID=UPI00321ABCFD
MSEKQISPCFLATSSPVKRESAVLLAIWSSVPGFKVKGQAKTSKAQKEDGAKDESDSERQKVGAGMSLHERDKLEGGHFHKAAREDADDAQEVHGHGDSKKAKELDPAGGGETGPGRKLVEGTMVVPAVLSEPI